jgi:hypothetical protein
MRPKSSLPIRVRIGFSRMSDGDLQTRTEKAAEGAKDPRLSGSPVSAADLKTAADEFRKASIAALDGGKMTRAAVVTSRENLIQMLRQYSIYGDVQAEGDPKPDSSRRFSRGSGYAVLHPGCAIRSFVRLLVRVGIKDR